jgi:HTH-type transcriptional regulator, transcriptional repressor of NAD biosynthesis genes
MNAGGGRARVGVVIGKFYPPHRGHGYLIDTALAAVDELTVIVCGKPEQAIPVELRAAWLRELHPAARVLAIDDWYPDDDSRLWAELTIGWLGRAPDVVFTSEDYGEAWARHLGCRHVLVDRARRVVPCSGTAIRRDPLAAWDYLEPPVRAFLAKRVCVVGAESSGTTTMARALAAHYDTAWVPEYGREYSELKVARGDFGTWTTDEFVHIAAEQCRREDEAAHRANRLLICDTDAFATGIWHRRYVGSRAPAVEAIADGRRYDLYLLTDADIPFVQDGLRDGEHIRRWMHDLFAAELAAQGRPYALLAGPHEARLARAVGLIDRLVLGKAA